MLTVEELVIESLYHRLVLINVKKPAASSPCSDEGASLSEEVDDEAPVSPSSPPRATAGLSATGTGGGLGFLVMNSLCPQIRRAYGMSPTFSLTQKLDQESGSGERSVISAQSSIAEEFLAEHGFEVTEEVEMILNTSEIQLMKTTLRSPELQVEMPPTWHFGSSLSYDMSSVSPDGDDNAKVLMPRGISLDNCHQFSIVKLEDKRDPSGHSLVLVQTSEGEKGGQNRIMGDSEQGALAGCANVLRKAKSLSEAEVLERSAKKLVKQKSLILPVPTPVLTSNKMSVFVQQGSDDMDDEEDLSVAEVEQRMNELVTSTDPEEVKARVVDLLQDLETQVSPDGSPKKSVANGSDNAVDSQLVIKERHEDSLCELQDKAFTMSGSYKMFNITGNTECVLTALEPLPESDASSSSRPSTFTSVTGPIPVMKTITKPVAEIQFSVEAGETQLEETISAIKDIKCQFNSSIPSSILGIVRPRSPTKALGQGDASHLVQHGTATAAAATENGISLEDASTDKSAEKQCLSQNVGSEILRNGFTTDGAEVLDTGADEVENVKRESGTLNVQNGDLSFGDPLSAQVNSSQTSCRYPSERSKKFGGYDGEPVSPIGYVPKQNRHSGSDFTSPRSRQQEVPSSPPHEWRRGRLPEDISMESMYFTPPESPDYEMRFSRARSPPILGSNEKRGLAARGNSESQSRKFCSSPRRRDHDTGLSLALQPQSRIVTYRDPASPMDSHSDLSDSFAFTESSEGDELASLCELDLPYDVPAYMRHPDWMSELPTSVYTKPLTELIIPGSHISLAIDREMRMDMDFSKCNYEMAEFLRKLPNLAIFNSFRGLMKKIWKAWMPKQTLTIAQQLDAGVRYLDLRVTKLRGSLYGEHGLYTRPLKRYLKEVKEFLEEHPKEVVILHFQTLDQLQMSDKRHLVTALFQAFGARLARVGIPGKTTLETLWKNKKQVIVIFPDEDMSSLRNHIFYGLVWSDFEIVAPYPNNMSIEELKSYLGLMDGDASPLKMAALEDKFHVVKAVLSPDMTMVFGEFKHRSMREMTENETEGVVMDWIRENPKRKINIIALDFVGTGMAVSNILQLNFPRCETVV